MMVLVEDKQGDIKQQFFYDKVPVGGKIRVFGSAEKFDENPMKLPREKKDEAIAMMVTRDPEQLVNRKADNYHRWFGTNWAFVEKGGESKAGDWNKASEARLKKFVDYGHRLGYFVGVYCLDGYSASENQGWDADYNFGSQGESGPAVAGGGAHSCRLHRHRSGGRGSQGDQGGPVAWAPAPPARKGKCSNCCIRGSESSPGHSCRFLPSLEA